MPVRKLLLLGVSATALLLAQPPNALALFGAGDTVFCVNCALEATQLTSWATQAADMLKTIAQLKMETDTLIQTYYALAHVTDLATAVAALNTLGIQNPLPIDPYAVQSILNGTGGAGGMIGSLGALYTGSSNTNLVYKVPGNSWSATELNQNGLSLAGAQAFALQQYQSAAQRFPLLQQLQDRISTASDPSERESLIARLNAEQAYIQNSQVQALNIGTFMQAQYQVEQQRHAEKLTQGIDLVLAQATARGVCACTPQ